MTIFWCIWLYCYRYDDTHVLWRRSTDDVTILEPGKKWPGDQLRFECDWRGNDFADVPDSAVMRAIVEVASVEDSRLKKSSRSLTFSKTTRNVEIRWVYLPNGPGFWIRLFNIIETIFFSNLSKLAAMVPDRVLDLHICRQRSISPN